MGDIRCRTFLGVVHGMVGAGRELELAVAHVPVMQEVIGAVCDQGRTAGALWVQLDRKVCGHGHWMQSKN